jgi:hypothetical protein
LSFDFRSEGHCGCGWHHRHRPGFSQETTSAPPGEVKHFSQPSAREKLIKIGANVVHHGRYVTFQLAEVALPRELFRKILRLIDGLRRLPAVPARTMGGNGNDGRRGMSG